MIYDINFKYYTEILKASWTSIPLCPAKSSTPLFTCISLSTPSLQENATCFVVLSTLVTEY